MRTSWFCTGDARSVIGRRIMTVVKLEIGIVIALLASVAVATAQQVAKLAHPYTNAPFASLPGATPATYATLDPSGTKAEGAIIDLTRAIAEDAGFQIQYVPMPVGDLIASLISK